MNIKWKFKKPKQFITYSLIGIISLMLLTGYKEYNCEQLEPNYVMCQRKIGTFFGLISYPNLNFRLTGVSLDKEIRTDEEGDRYYVHKIYLKSDKGLLLLDSYRSSRKELAKPIKIEIRIKYLILGGEETLFNYKAGFLWNIFY